MGRLHRLDDDTWLLFRAPPSDDPRDPNYFPREYFSEGEIVCATDLTHGTHETTISPSSFCGRAGCA